MTHKIVFITGNQNKADYLAKFLGMPVDHQKVDLDEIQSVVLRDVVKHKARQAYELVKKTVIVDDVSLEFFAMGGLPGPFVRWFVEEGPEKMCRMLDSFSDRSAVGKAGVGYFDGVTFSYFEGNIEGVIADNPRGEGGYGWDKIFEPTGYNGRTRAELTEEEYEELYLRIRPIAELRHFLESRRVEI